MPKLKCTFEFFESNILSEFGYSLHNPIDIDIDNGVCICDIQGPNLEQYSDDDIVFMELNLNENQIKIKKTGKWPT